MVDSKIVKFVESHHLLSLATIDEDGSPYCASAFYSFRADKEVFVFSTDPTTQHGVNMVRDARVSATIALETKVVGKIQGVQIVGRVEEATTGDKLNYIATFPSAAAIPSLHLWRLKVQMFKLTDNRLGFGKKLIWRSE